MKEPIQTPMNSTDFALRSFARVKGIPQQANINRSLRPANICLLDSGDTHGKDSCLRFMILDLTRYFAISPGRFFAVNEVKALLAYIVATYDIKWEEGKGVPREHCIAGFRFPGKANMMFRTRQK
jgi:hypothetical protein